MDSFKVLITTSDYLPNLGGLTSYTCNIESSLRELGISYELFHWRGKNKKSPDFSKFAIIFNVHYLGGYLNNEIKRHPRVVNFVHGSEILFYSSNILKRIVKRFLKKQQLNYFEKSYKNIFISNFTKEKLKLMGLREDFSRDIIIHNSIPVCSSERNNKSLKTEEIAIACIARDVPHKNLNGVIEFAKLLKKVSNKKIAVYLTSNKKISYDGITFYNIKNISNDKRDELFLSIHFNLLLSLDHSHKGFYEGFGLSVLEGNVFGVPGVVLSTGGLPENVHHKFNGYVFNEITLDSVNDFWVYAQASYFELKENCQSHVAQDHSLDQFKQLINFLISHDQAVL